MGVYSRQQEVWASVSSVQGNLSHMLSADVASPSSETSLQLSLENEKLQKARAAYVEALQARRRRQGRHRRLRIRHQRPHRQRRRLSLQRAVPQDVAEAAGRRRDGGDRRGGRQPHRRPNPEAAAQFLQAAEKGSSHEEVVNDLSRQEVHDADAALLRRGAARRRRLGAPQLPWPNKWQPAAP